MKNNGGPQGRLRPAVVRKGTDQFCQVTLM